MILEKFNHYHFLHYVPVYILYEEFLIVLFFDATW